VQRGVDLAVAAGSRRWRLVLGADRDRRHAGGARELGLAAEALGAGDLADELGRRERPETGLGEQLRRDPGDEVGDLGLERVDGDGQLAQAAQLVADDPNVHRLLSARETPSDLRGPCLGEQRATEERELGPEVVQIPLQRAVERDACGPGVRDGRPAGGYRAPGPPTPPSAASRFPPQAPRARPTRHRSDRSCRARGLSAGPRPFAASRRERHARHARSRTAPARPRHAGVLRRPHPLAIQAARPDHQRREPTGTDRDRLVAEQLTARSAATVCERLWASAPSTIMTPSTSLPMRMLDARRTRLAGGAATLLSSHAEHPRPATSDTTKASQATPADNLKESQLAARSGPSPRRRTTPTTESKQQASKEQPATDRHAPRCPCRPWRS
jgi:hypothetical protein